MIVISSLIGVSVWVWETTQLVQGMGGAFGFGVPELLPLLGLVALVEVSGALLLAWVASIVSSITSSRRVFATAFNLVPILSGGLTWGPNWLPWVGLVASVTAIGLVWMDRLRR